MEPVTLVPSSSPRIGPGNAIWAPARGLSMSDVWATDGVVGRWKLFGLRIAEFITDV